MTVSSTVPPNLLAQTVRTVAGWIAMGNPEVTTASASRELELQLEQHRRALNGF